MPKKEAPVSTKGLFHQNVIAVIWDFDRTLSPHYMQKPIFEHYGIDEDAFWKESNALCGYYAKAGIEVQSDTAYLGHMLSYVKQGLMPDLTNDKLKELGARIEFFPGIPEIFDRLKDVLNEPAYQEGDLKLENYIVSTGLDAMIRGSKIADKVDGIWASVFIEVPAAPNADLSGDPASGPISQIAGFLDNTTKTRAIFEINKGVNKTDSISVNDSIPEEDRRVPFRNMIYIADGPSDVPSFSVIRKHGGLAYAVYDDKSHDQFSKAIDLRESDRVDDYGEANYEEFSKTDKWLQLKVRQIATKIMDERKRVTDSRVRKGPNH